MATKTQHITLERRHFEEVKHHLPEHTTWCANTVEKLLEKGFIQVSTVAEHAVAYQQGCDVVGQDANDLEYGGDVKLCSVRTSNYGCSYSAPVTNIHGKSGWLYVQVYERKQDKFYWFAIPREAYSHIPKTSNIEIPFELDGTPRRRNRCSINWWDYEQPDFKTMSIQGLTTQQLSKRGITPPSSVQLLTSLNQKLVQTQRRTRRPKIANNIFEDLFHVDYQDPDWAEFVNKVL